MNKRGAHEAHCKTVMYISYLCVTFYSPINLLGDDLGSGSDKVNVFFFFNIYNT